MKFHSKRVAALAALALSGAMVLTACGDDDERRAADGGGGGDTTDRHVPAEEPRQPLLRRHARGGEEAVEEFGGTFDQVGPAGGHPRRAGAVHQHRRPAGRERAGRLGQRPDALCDALDEASDAGTKVVTFDSDTDPDCRDLYVNQATSEGIAKTQVDLIAEQIGDAGEIAILSATANATNQNAWIEMMEAELEANHPDIELVDTVYGDDDDQKSFDQTAALLQNHPDLKGIISPTTVGIAAAARYLSDSEYKGKVKLTGLGSPNEMREYVEDGTIDGVRALGPRGPRLPGGVHRQGAGRRRHRGRGGRHLRGRRARRVHRRRRRRRPAR